MEEKKNKKLLLIGLTIIVAAIVVIAAAIVFMGSNSDPTRFHGHWNVDIFGLGGSGDYWSFYDNGTFRAIDGSDTSSDGTPNFALDVD